MTSLSARALRATTASFALALSFIAYPTHAKDYVPSSFLAAPTRISEALQPGGRAGLSTTEPGGFIGFEMHYPNEIRDSAPAFAAFAEVGAARTINGTVNGDITWRETRLWTIAPDGPSDGDCKTYALTKEHDLRLQGTPDGTLRLLIVDAAHQGLHMILELRTLDGVYVLDSLKNDSGDTFYKVAAMPASYTVLKYQTWGGPEHWLTPAALGPQHGVGPEGHAF